MVIRNQAHFAISYLVTWPETYGRKNQHIQYWSSNFESKQVRCVFQSLYSTQSRVVF